MCLLQGQKVKEWIYSELYNVRKPWLSVESHLCTLMFDHYTGTLRNGFIQKFITYVSLGSQLNHNFGGTHLLIGYPCFMKHEANSFKLRVCYSIVLCSLHFWQVYQGTEFNHVCSKHILHHNIFSQSNN